MFFLLPHNLVTGDPGSAQSSSGNVNARMQRNPNQVNTLLPDHLRRWTKDHPPEDHCCIPLVLYQTQKTSLASGTDGEIVRLGDDKLGVGGGSNICLIHMITATYLMGGCLYCSAASI
ncbi:hypothetical protein Tco_0389145 [Tanacetum coccineum]